MGRPPYWQRRHGSFGTGSLLPHPGPHHGRQARLTRGTRGAEGRRRHQLDHVRPPQAGRAEQGFVRQNAPSAPPAETIVLDEPTHNWVKAFWALQSGHFETISLVVNKGSRPSEVKPEPDLSWYVPDRGLLFLPVYRRLPPQSIGSALRRGWDDTIENILSIYGTIRGLVVGRLGPKGVAGPITIVQLAYDTARSSITDLIHFLGILSINLAVINFLPIPPLDGGQMLFLVAEKVRGRPLPDSALSAGILVGIVLVIALMVFVLSQDVLRIIEHWKGF